MPNQAFIADSWQMMIPFRANGKVIVRPDWVDNTGLCTGLKRHIEVSPGESVRILRELQELSQNELGERCEIPQSTISAIENDRVQLGVERAKVLARALKCHPAVLVFPGWDVEIESAA
jgi:DNA-binding XRE family transcriptional regulator